MLNNEENKRCYINGIFIKHVLENSPASLNGTLSTGDRILAVDDVDLTQATHDKAVEAIRKCKSPVVFTIQSLLVNSYGPNLGEVKFQYNSMLFFKMFLN